MNSSLAYPEQASPELGYHLASLIGLSTLVAFYFFGVWSRSYVFPSEKQLPVSKQLIAAVPVGLITMGIYAKTAFPAMANSINTVVFDAAIALGYAIIFGMLSRESLDRLMADKSLVPAIPAPQSPAKFPTAAEKDGLPGADHGGPN